MWNLFKNNKEKIDTDALNYKDLELLKLNKIIRSITTLFYSLIINGLGGLSYYYISQNTNSNSLSVIMQSTSFITTTFGVFGLNGIAWITHKISRPKQDKQIKKNNMPILRINKLAFILLFISLIPLMFWFFGRLIVLIKCRIYKKQNNSYERIENAQFNQNNINNLVDKKIVKTLKEVIKK